MTGGGHRLSNMDLVAALLEQLHRQGVREVVLCAGARNAPFVAWLAGQKPVGTFETYSFFEERSAGFFALGRALATARPVAVITTSGTAVAELLPAVIEADYQGVPLVLLTADRPSEYRGSGSPQTINQVGLFSHYVENAWDIEGELPAALEIAAHRPTHLNVCFDEPLIDGEITQAHWNSSDSRERSALRAPIGPEGSGHGVSARRPLILLGALPKGSRLAVLRWLLEAKAPVYAEAQSGLRGHSDLEPYEVRGGPPSLRRLNYDGVIRIGGVPTVRLWRDLENSKKPVWHYSHLPFSGMSRVREVARLEDLPRLQSESAPELSADRERADRLTALLADFPSSEPAMFRWLSLQIPRTARLFVGNSLPIREWDLTAAPSATDDVFANRGVNGIDGLISTFLGVSVPQLSNWCILGDLSTLYDLSGPWALRARPITDVNLVVINNGGGKIFSRMFKNPLFENPHDLEFGHWAAMWGLEYLTVTSPRNLPEATRPRVIEVRPDAAQTEKFWQCWEEDL
jgi:2-succinyl-5-enolpyruvyl-6-hydroxy-3-cyclohexene-1-carboxylate synthase